MVATLPVTHAAANGPTVTGAGSTWVQIALDQWRADIAQQGYSINYQGVGSSAGRSFFSIGQVDFAASEIPFQPAELSNLHRSYQYLPDVAGGTSLMYNLHAADGSHITSLRLNADAAAKIFTGAITSWQDPEIQALNPGLSITETGIIPVIRSDGSGTSAQFSLYLASQAPGVWNAFVANNGCPAPCSQWPPFPGSAQQSGSDGVANFVANDSLGSGAIGYVEAGYAFGRAFPIARLRNASGNFVPSAVDPNNGPQVFSQDVSTALTHARLHADLTQDLSAVYTAPEPNAYPMSSYSYMITQTTGFDPAKGAVLGTWIIYIACGGQQEATPLGYSPLPPNLVQADFAAVARIPGAPAPPPIDKQHCPNPTVTANAAGGSAGGGGGGSGGGGASSGGGAGGHSGLASGASTAGLTPTGGQPVPGGGLTGTIALSNGQIVKTLTSEQRASLALAAERVAAGAPLPSQLPLALAAAAVVAVVIGPVLLRPRRRHPHANERTSDAS
ncbi:MAG: substrate-binding domain-containing protein [Candidatus Dormibacteraeota bacterium]|nr:substrate-binding domain-containing protein [Candidatus Dormibacteraeota bacterium]